MLRCAGAWQLVGEDACRSGTIAGTGPPRRRSRGRGVGRGRPAVRDCRADGAGDASASWRSGRRLGWPRRADGFVANRAGLGTDRLEQRGESDGEARRARRLAGIQGRAAGPAILRLALVGRAARDIGMARQRHFDSVRQAMASAGRADEGGQQAGRDEQGQNQAMREAPKLHGLKMPRPGRSEKLALSRHIIPSPEPARRGCAVALPILQKATLSAPLSWSCSRASSGVAISRPRPSTIWRAARTWSAFDFAS